MAHGDAVQSRRLSDQRVPLDLLRQGRRGYRSQYGRGRLLPGAVPGRDFLGVPDGVSAEELTAERSEEHTSELQSLMRISYAVFCLKKKTYTHKTTTIYIS